MNRTIGLWMLIGFAVAASWVIVGLLIGPAYNLGRSNLIAISAPAVFLGRKLPLGAAWFILLNGFLYGLVGVIVGLVRRQRDRKHA